MAAWYLQLQKGWLEAIHRCIKGIIPLSHVAGYSLYIDAVTFLGGRAGTTTRSPVPRGMYEECKLSFLTDIDKCINKHNIPPELVLNADQTPSSYVSVGRMTMAEKNSKSVPIKGLTDKRNITLTFVISLAGEFLPMQVIYQGKTKASLPRNFVFPKGFCFTQNPKHYSNEEETLKLIDSIINPYLVQTRQQLKLPPTQKAILIWDVFWGQTTERVLSKLASLNIEIVSVRANMTHFFQPLDLTVNGQAKKFCKEKFTTWYSQEVQRQLDSGTSFEEIEVDLRMSVIKPLHAGWLVALYDYLTGAEGRRCIFKGWEKAGVKEIVNSDKPLPPCWSIWRNLPGLIGVVRILMASKRGLTLWNDVNMSEDSMKLKIWHYSYSFSCFVITLCDFFNEAIDAYDFIK